MFYVIVVWVTPIEADRERHFHSLQRLRWFQVCLSFLLPSEVIP